MVTIVLTDNTTIQAKLNGNNYITTEKVEETKLDKTNLVKIKIDDKEYTNMKCQYFDDEENKQHLIFMPITDDELEKEKLNVKLQYLALMCDVELGD